MVGSPIVLFLEAADYSTSDLANSRRWKPTIPKSFNRSPFSIGWRTSFARPGGLLPIVAVSLLSFWSSGCIQMAALWTNMTGGDIVEPEYALTKGPLLILVDDRNNFITQPAAIRNLQNGIADRFLEYRVNSRVVPFSEWQRLQQSDKGYDKMTIREIGAKLGADQVLYIRVDRFTLQAEPGAPLFKGDFSVRVKVVSTARQADVRVWPRERSGRRVSSTTEAQSSESGKSASQITEDLTKDLSRKIAELFYEHREFAE
jgi:hypothetical protein